MTKHLQGVCDAVLDARLEAVGCAVLEGQKAVGKTATAARRAASEVRLDTDVNAREIARADPSLVLEGAAPRLIDEWQIVPDIWNHVRRAVDDIGSPGQFILTGSAAASDDVARHSGAGRIDELAGGRTEFGGSLTARPVRREPRPGPAPRLADLSIVEAPPGLVHDGSSPEAKAAFFGAPFAARTDVYAVRYDNPYTGRAVGCLRCAADGANDRSMEDLHLLRGCGGLGLPGTGRGC
jgi:AAA domain